MSAIARRTSRQGPGGAWYRAPAKQLRRPATLVTRRLLTIVPPPTARPVPPRLLLLGIPGSGKGTQGGMLRRDFELEVIAAGDLLRNTIKNENHPLAPMLRRQIREGGLVDNETMLQLIRVHLHNLHGKGWVLDGYPRTQHQASDLDAFLKSTNQAIDVAFHLHVDAETLYDERIKDRLVHVGSGRVYHRTYKPPKRDGIDDITGEPLEKREDDNKDTVLARLRGFAQETEPLLSFFRAAGTLCTIDAPTSHEGYKIIRSIMEQRFGLQPKPRAATSLVVADATAPEHYR